LNSAAAREKATLAVAFCFFLNRLLERESWARQKLAPFAGESVELRGPAAAALRVTIEPDGRVSPGGENPTLVVTLTAEALPALARGEEHLMRSIEVAGNAKLAAEVMALARNLRWDAEEDLSRLVGDIAAHRVMAAARSLAAWQADAARRLAETFADYAAEEKRVLVRRPELHAHAREVAALREALERLCKRIERAE
jgi:ubiquinone biosynthesis protein UbiJ